MKTQYSYHAEFNEDEDLVWIVKEKATDQIVGEFWFEDEAEELAKFLERGGGFAGFTPSFVLRKTSVNINEAFAAEFSE